jgi:hypothetical protein
MTVADIEQKMSWREFRDWQRFENVNLYPLPDRLFDVHMATLISTLINVMTSSSTPARVIDYLRLREGLARVEEEGLTDIDEIGRQLDAMQGRR